MNGLVGLARVYAKPALSLQVEEELGKGPREIVAAESTLEEKGRKPRLTCPLAFPRVSFGGFHPRKRELNATGLFQAPRLCSIRERPGGRVGEPELSREVVEVRHRRVFGERGHFVWGDVRGTSLLQCSQGACELGWRRRWGLAAHVQARRGVSAELWHRAPLECARVLVELCGRIVLLLTVHGGSRHLGGSRPEQVSASQALALCSSQTPNSCPDRFDSSPLLSWGPGAGGAQASRLPCHRL